MTTSKPNYRALRIIAWVYKRLGELLIGLASIAALRSVLYLLSIASPSLLVFGVGVAIALGVALMGLLALAVGEAISVGIDVAANTWRMADAMTKPRGVAK